ncbi:piRNA biogenesis protein EXD1-like [Oratosquilla oratoria]|uniref:piRNA biogenesis protein EXD1-like n=1 Tax=Oratosquilla oratoria TaxID=337810 RepID=UPI003F75FD36
MASRQDLNLQHAAFMVSFERHLNTSLILAVSSSLVLQDHTSDCLGLRVLLRAKEGSYLGVVNYVLEESKRLGLEKVSNPKTGKRRVGLLSFFFHQVLDLQVVGEDAEARVRLLKDIYSEQKHGKKLLTKKIVPPHLLALNEVHEFDEDILLGRSSLYSRGEGTGENSKDAASSISYLPPPPPPPPGIVRPEKWVIIDQMDKGFYEAINCVCEDHFVSLGMEGRKLGRSGALSWLILATSKCIFLFDIAQMGPQAITLKPVSKKDPMGDKENGRRKMKEFVKSNGNQNCKVSANISEKQNSECIKDTGHHILRNDHFIINGNILSDQEHESRKEVLNDVCDRTEKRERKYHCLGDVLTDPHIMKIVHDSRNKEDLLHHQYGINLENVFDTQATEVYVYMLNHHGTAPSFVSGLPSLLIKYLHLLPHHVFFPRVRQECVQNDESVWFERPLPNALYEGMAQSVMYLQELRLALLNLVMVDLVQITNIYLGAFRDKDAVVAENLEPHVVPEEIQRLVKRSSFNQVNVHDPYISYSRNATKVRLPKTKYDKDHKFQYPLQ